MCIPSFRTISLTTHDDLFVMLHSPTPQELAVQEEVSTLVPVLYHLSCPTRGQSHQTHMLERSVMLTTLVNVAMVKIGALMSSQMIDTANR